MDSQDMLALMSMMEGKEGFEDNDTIIYFFALQHYLTFLANNKGTLTRITKVTSMMNNILPEVQTYFQERMKDANI